MNIHEVFGGDQDMQARATAAGAALEFTIREAERARIMMREMDRVNSVVREIERAEAATREVLRAETMIREVDQANATIRELDRANAMAREIQATEFTLPDDWLENVRIPVKSIGSERLPLPEFPESRTLAEFQEMSDDEIRTFLDDNPSLVSVQLALHELAMRRLDRATRPHWSVTPTFWLVVASVAVAVIGVLLVIHW